MKSNICACVIILLLQIKSTAAIENKLIAKNADTSIVKNVQKKEVNNSDWENLLKSLDCNDANYEKDVKTLTKSIESELSSMIKRLSTFKKDTMRSKPLIAALTKELKTYKASIENDATILFWSYGIASMQGERVVSRNCYYLAALRKRLSFIKAVNEKIEGSLLM